jgi:hypothetical protein
MQLWAPVSAREGGRAGWSERSSSRQDKHNKTAIIISTATAAMSTALSGNIENVVTAAAADAFVASPWPFKTIYNNSKSMGRRYFHGKKYPEGIYDAQSMDTEVRDVVSTVMDAVKQDMAERTVPTRKVYIGNPALTFCHDPNVPDRKVVTEIFYQITARAAEPAEEELDD